MAELLEVLKKYKTDPDKESEGVWDALELAPGVAFEVKVASVECKEYRNRIIQAIAELGSLEDMSDEEADRRMAEHIAGAILTDWKLTHEGTEIPFDEETAVEMLASMRPLREGVMRLARDRARFRADKLEEVAERLGNFCTGGSSTADSSVTKPSKSGSKEATKPKAGTTGKTGKAKK